MNRYEGLERLAAGIRSDFRRDMYESAIESDIVKRSSLILIDQFFMQRSEDDIHQLITSSGDRARLLKLNEMAPPNTTELINLLISVL